MAIFNNAAWSMRINLRVGGLPYDLTGKSLEMRIALTPDNPTVIPITTSNGRLIVVDALNGGVDITLSKEDMGNFIARTYVFEFGWSNAPNGYVRLFGGRFPVKQGIPQ